VKVRAEEHPLKAAGIAALVIVLTVTCLAALVYLLICHTFEFFAVVAALALWVRVSIWVRRWRFVRANQGKTFVLFTPRHGWYEFVTNNVEPVLPQDWKVVWYVRPGLPPTFKRHPLMGILYQLPLQDRPVAIRSTGRRLELRELRHAFQPLKLRGMQRDPAIQAEIRSVLESAFEPGTEAGNISTSPSARG
jgi:hypothetical protein